MNIKFRRDVLAADLADEIDVIQIVVRRHFDGSEDGLAGLWSQMMRT